MQWGVTYSARCNVEEVASAIEASAAGSAMKVRPELSAPATLVILLTQTAPWYRVVLRALPQRLRWRLQQSGDGTTITCEAYYFWWYAGLIVLMCAILGTLFISGSTVLGNDWRNISPTQVALDTGMLLASLPLLFAVAYLLTAISGRGTEAFWNAIRYRVEVDGRLVMPRDRVVNGLYVLCVTVYLAFVIALVVWLLGGRVLHGNWSASIDRLFLLALGGLVVGIACLLIAVGLAVRRVGFVQRLGPMLPGIMSLMSILFVVMIPFPILVISGIDTPETERAIERLRAAIVERPPGWTEEEYAERRPQVIQALEKIQVWAWISLAGIVLIGAVAAALIVDTLGTALPAWAYRARISHFADHPAMQDTVSGRGFLPWFRFLWVIVWGLVAGLILLGMGSIGYGALEAVLGTPILIPLLPLPHPPMQSLLVVNIAFGRQMGDTTLGPVVRLLWISYGLICLGMLTCSVGQLVGDRWRTLQTLYNERANGTQKHRRARQMLERLADKASLDLPHLVIYEDHEPYATSHRFGWLRPVRFIEVSSECLSLLKDDELEALLAHELAHHLNGNCLIDNVMQLLGRLSFVGDSTVRALQHTFGYELYADRVAVEKLEVDPTALKRCLWRVHHVSAAESGATFRLIYGLGALKLTPNEYSKALAANLEMLPASKRWRLAVRLYLKQYTSAGDAVYWHPPIAKRVAELKKLEGASYAGQRVTSPRAS